MAFAFDTPGVLTRLVELAEALSGVNGVKKGAPESWSNRLSAAVTMAGQSVEDDGNGLLTRESRFLVLFGYRVQGAEAQAEETLAAVVDAFLPAVYSDTALNGLLSGVHADANVSDTVAYQEFAGQEVRLYGVTVRGQQMGQF